LQLPESLDKRGLSKLNQHFAVLRDGKSKPARRTYFWKGG